MDGSPFPAAPVTHISLLLPLAPQSQIAFLLLPPIPQSHIASLLLPSTGNCFLQMCFTFLLGGKSLRQDLWLSRLHIPMAPGKWYGWSWSPPVLTGLHWLSVCPTWVLQSRAGHLFGLMSPPVPSFKSLPFWELPRVRG